MIGNVAVEQIFATFYFGRAADVRSHNVSGRHRSINTHNQLMNEFVNGLCFFNL